MVKIENLEQKNMVKLIITVEASEFDKAIEKAYQKNKNKIQIQGFRKGKAPRSIIEKMYGKGVFYEDAANEVIPEAYAQAAKESGLEIVSRPGIDVVELEDGKDFVFSAEVAVKPEAEIGNYKGIEVEAVDTTVTEDDINAEILKTQEQNSRMVTVEDRAVQDGDMAIIDYEGSVDGVPFDGGKGENHELVIGSHSFIDGFEDQIIGHSIGDEFDVNVTFPAEYHAPNLAGKPAVFKTKVNGIKKKELPALDDDFAQDVSEFDTFEEYKADVKKKLEEDKEKAAKSAKEDAAVEAIVADAKMDIPAPMIDTQAEQMYDDFVSRMKQQGLTIDMYFKFTGLNEEKLMEQIRPQAEKRIKSRLVLEAVAKAEGFKATDEEIEEEIKKMADQYQMEVDKLKELITDAEKKSIAEDICVTKAVDLISSTLVEKKGTKKAAKKAAPKKDEAENDAEDDAEEKKAPAKKTTAKKAAPKKTEE
ncbi:MAG: trigger factor [Lachnospiraceae bacterium]|nr:trigger factor [Lachnospiraceae bacterium]